MVNLTELFTHSHFYSDSSHGSLTTIRTTTNDECLLSSPTYPMSLILCLFILPVSQKINYLYVLKWIGQLKSAFYTFNAP